MTKHKTHQHAQILTRISNINPQHIPKTFHRNEDLSVIFNRDCPLNSSNSQIFWKLKGILHLKTKMPSFTPNQYETLSSVKLLKLTFKLDSLSLSYTVYHFFPCSTEESKSYGFGIKWEWIRNDCWVNYPFNNHLQLKVTSLFVLFFT